jgi:hypothetical protein
MRKIKTVHVDLDGTVADFGKHYADHFKAIAHREDIKVLWKNINQYDAAGGRWFYDIPPMEDAAILFDGLQSRGVEIRILTATGWNYEHGTQQKVDWCARHFGIKRQDVVTVRKSEDKGRFATPNCVLIDDYDRSIDSFRASGGHVIKHYNAVASLAHLDQLIDSFGKV